MSIEILTGDCRAVLATMDPGSVHCCVTSPPYFGLRDYGHEGQIGLESSPQEYVDALVAVFREVRRVLRDDGTLWLNLGDSYAASGRGGGGGSLNDKDIGVRVSIRNSRRAPVGGLKQKDLIGIPWRVAFALQADGWYLRQDIIWSKPNPMPESVRDRCTKSHEYVFLLSKSRRYYFDQESIAEPVAESTRERLSQPTLADQVGSDRQPGKTNGRMKAAPPRFGGSKYGDSDDEKLRTKSGNDYQFSEKRNRRSVWEVATRPFSEAHFAVMPVTLAEICVKAGAPEGGRVLDPFGGAGTTALAADRLGRDAVIVELNEEYADIAERRLREDAPLFSAVTRMSLDEKGPERGGATGLGG